jgi:CSLREA domain-containing protein
VTSTTDAVDGAPGNGVCAAASGACTLRAAVQEANALAGAHVILVPAGTYTLAVAGRNEDNAAAGDLDVRRNVTIDGAGAGATILDGNSIDRLFHIVATGVQLHLIELTLQRGDDGGGAAGGVYAEAAQAALTLTSTVVRTLAGRAVLGANRTTLRITDTRIENNDNGISLSNLAQATIERAAILTNRGLGLSMVGAAQGSPAPIVRVTDTTIAQNTMGGAYLFAVKATLTRVAVFGNTTVDNGAGISTYAERGWTPTDITIEDSSIEGNRAGNWGGGLLIRIDYTYPEEAISSVTIIRSTIAGNTAGAAGGIYISGGSLMVANTTITGNSGPYFAAAFYGSRGNVNFLNATIAGNTSSGPAIENHAFTSATNTIVTNSGSASNCYWLPITDGGHNLEFPGTSCGFTKAAVHADPRLLPLDVNGGTTRTHRLGISSPARDAGDDAACAWNPVSGLDQRGAHRPTGTHCDIGAYETATPPFQDDPLIAGVTPVRAVHISELRLGINDLRTRFGLADVPWLDPALNGVLVKAGHVQQMRAAVLEAYAAAGRLPPPFSDPVITPTATPIRAMHLTELRNALKAVP